MEVKTLRSGTEITRQVFYTQISSPDDKVVYEPATSYIGKVMPFHKPLALCFVEVTPSNIAFAVQAIPKKERPVVAKKVIELPKGTLSMLHRKAKELESTIDPSEVVVEMRTRVEPGKFESTLYYLTLSINDGIAFLEPKDRTQDTSYVLPQGNVVHMAIVLKSKIANRSMSISFAGFLGKPGQQSSIEYITSQVLFNLTYTAEFKMLMGIQSVHIPSNAQAARPVETPSIVFPVSLYTPDGRELVATGMVEAKVDLVHANPSLDMLLLHLTPSTELTTNFNQYASACNRAITQVVRSFLSDDEINAISQQILLGGVDEPLVDRVRSSLAPLHKGVALTTNDHQLLPG